MLLRSLLICLFYCNFTSDAFSAFTEFHKGGRQRWGGNSGSLSGISSSKVVHASTSCTSTKPIWVPSSSCSCQLFMYSNKSPRDNSNNGVGETAAGAILGGLLMGPLGALWGASIGANVGAKRSMEQAKRQEMERLGISQEMVDMAQDISISLQRAMEGYRVSQDSLRIQQSLAQRLEAEVQELQEGAKRAIIQGDEERAREILLRKKNKMDRWKEILLKCAEEKDRAERMKENVEALEQRAIEVDALIRRSVSAKALQDTSNSRFLLEDTTSEVPSASFEDPLLRKFRELEGY
jgi:hypothetical protein